MQEGEALVAWPEAYAAQVQALLMDWSARYDTLQQWQGPHSFEETPVGKLLAHEGIDPKVCSAASDCTAPTLRVILNGPPYLSFAALFLGFCRAAG